MNHHSFPPRPPIPLARISDPCEFYPRYFRAGKPVVVTGAAKAVPAFQRWTDEYLAAVLGDTPAKVRLGNGEMGEIPFQMFLKYLAAPQSFSSSRGAAYLVDFYVRPPLGDARRAQLSSEVVFPLERRAEFAEWITVYAGPPNTSTAMHQDIFDTHTWLAELRGQKTWRLCAPDALTKREGEPDAFDGSDLGCDVWEAVLDPGDLIYLPPNWWHQVRNESSSTLALSGNFCTYPQARAHLEQALAHPDEQLGKQWSTHWSAVLDGQPLTLRSPTPQRSPELERTEANGNPS
jgi:ribosomal protein L16 Arg81 hydroxylase